MDDGLDGEGKQTSASHETSCMKEMADRRDGLESHLRKLKGEERAVSLKKLKGASSLPNEKSNGHQSRQVSLRSMQNSKDQ